MSSEHCEKNGRLTRRRIRRRAGEPGYALLAVLAGLTILLILMSAAVPAYQHELQRDKEEEMFWRGQQVAMALVKNAQLRGRYPTKLEDLVEPFESPQGTTRLLRPTALCDPLMPCEEGSNWRAVRPGDPLIRKFYDAYLAEMTSNPEKRLPPPPQDLAQMARAAQAAITGLSNSGPQRLPRDSEFASSLKTELGPIYGVVSKSKKELIRNYFSFQTYDEALFFAGISEHTRYLQSAGFRSATTTECRSHCRRALPEWWSYFEQDGKGFCGGVMNPGRLCRGPDGVTIPCPEGQK